MKNINDLKKDWLRREIGKLSTKGITKADIARSLDVKPQYLNTLLNSDRGITDQFLDKFIEVYNIAQFDLLPIASVSLQSETTADSTLLSIIKQKDGRIEELAKTVGRLEHEIEELKKGSPYDDDDIEDVGGVACADVG